MITLTIRKPSVFIASLMIAAGVLAACTTGDDTQPSDSGPGATSVPASSVTGGAPSAAAEPGTWVFETLDYNFDASYRISMDLLDGYAGNDSFVVLGTDDGQGMSAWTVGNVYAEPCHWRGTLLDPPIDSSVGGLVAGLASQEGRHASAASDVTLDGFSGKYMELTVPARTDLADCQHGQFRTWVDPTGGARWLEPGQHDLLWIVDVDGSRLVIDAALGPDTTEQDRADRIQMVESIRIDPL